MNPLGGTNICFRAITIVKRKNGCLFPSNTYGIHLFIGLDDVHIEHLIT